MTGLDTLKPLLTALVLPPVPWLLLVLLGASVLVARRRLGALLLVTGVALVWLSACAGSGRWLQDALLPVPPPLSAARLAALGVEKDAAIAVLGGGRLLHVPETGMADLATPSLERLRYGVRLARQTGLPLAFLGGAGWSAQVQAGASEAEIARQVAERDFDHPLRWLESASRDTHQNARFGVPLLHDAGVRHIVLVTHALHMPRALHEFDAAAAGSVRITPAPMGYFSSAAPGPLDWLPSAEGFKQVRGVLHERLGLSVARWR